MKLPRLNSYVYIITYVDGEPYCVTRDQVYMKNKNAFIVEEALYGSVIEEYRIEHYNDGYMDTWCKTFKEVKEILRQNEIAEIKYGHNVHYILVKGRENSWNVEEE
jgi:hypothetical protein